MNDSAANPPQSPPEADEDTPADTEAVEAADGPSAADMVPMDGAFDTIAHGAAAGGADDTGEHQEVEAAEEDDTDEEAEVIAPRVGLLARLRGMFSRGSVSSEDAAEETQDDAAHPFPAGEPDTDTDNADGPRRSRWAVPAMIAGGLLIGVGASSAVAWKMIATRNAEVASHTEVVEEQSRLLAAQAAKIETLLREADARPAVVAPVTTEPEAVTEGAAPAGQAAAAEAPAASPPAHASAPAAPSAAAAHSPAPAPAAAPVARSAEAARPTQQAAATERPVERERTAQAEPTRAGSPPPRESGSGMCDVPPGKDAVKSMRRCIDWFNGVDGSAARQSK